MIAIEQQQGASTPAPQIPPPSGAYRPQRILGMPGHVAGTFNATPRGVILHGSRSANRQSLGQEFTGTSAWAQNASHELGWNATVGEDEVAVHIAARQWGWNARAASSKFLAVEFAQPLESYDITDAQVRAFCWLFRHRFKAEWPTLPANFPTHAEVEAWGLTGAFDGKTDVFSHLSPRAEDLRTRIKELLNSTWETQA